MAEADQNVQAHAVAIRPPQFSTARSKNFFIILENQFETNHITNDSTKFRHAITYLPPEVTDYLSEADLTSGDYQALKEKVISKYTRSESQKFKELVTIPTTLTSKPTVFLQQLRDNASSWNLPEDFLRQHFLSVMPTSIRLNLIGRNENLEELATLADNLLEYSQIQNSSFHTYPVAQVKTENKLMQHKPFMNRNYPQNSQSSNNNNSMSNIASDFTQYSDINVGTHGSTVI